jgi:glycosyltransferase involved in cell wall biosynthesis
LLEYAVAHTVLLLQAARLLCGGVDVLHIHNPPDTLFPALLLARACRRRGVFDNHDLMTDLFVLRFGRSPFLRLIQWAQRVAFTTADLVITSNQSQREVVIATGTSPHRVVVVRNAPPQNMFRRSLAPAAPVLRQVSDFRVLFLGLLAPQDGVLTLPDLLYTLRTTYRLNVEICVVGDGALRRQLAARATRLGVGDYWTVTGRVPYDQVPSYLSTAHVCVDPAPCNAFNDRCTMVKITEYLAAGKPVVAFPLKETIRTAGDAVVYAQPNDMADFAACVTRLLRDDGDRQRLVARALARAELLTWERSERALLGAYRHLVPPCIAPEAHGGCSDGNRA